MMFYRPINRGIATVAQAHILDQELLKLYHQSGVQGMYSHRNRDPVVCRCQEHIGATHA